LTGWCISSLLQLPIPYFFYPQEFALLESNVGFES